MDVFPKWFVAAVMPVCCFACSAEDGVDASFELGISDSALYSSWHGALLTRRITLNDQSHADRRYCGDKSKDMSWVNNTCMLPLPTGTDVVGINRAYAASILGLSPASSLCNTCVEVRLGQRTVRGRIVDECPECISNHLDLYCSMYWDLYDGTGGNCAFDGGGRLVGAQWRMVDCSTSGPIKYAFKSGSANWGWFAVQIRNYSTIVTHLELQPTQGGSWTSGYIDDNGFFEFGYLNAGGHYRVRINGTVVDTVTLPNSSVTNPQNQVTFTVAGDSSQGGSSSECTDIPPDTLHTCQQQREWNKCVEPWMQGFCRATCGQCKP